MSGRFFGYAIVFRSFHAWHRLLPEYRKAGYRHFVRLLRKLMKLRQQWEMYTAPEREQKRKAFRAAIKAASNGGQGAWLQEALAGLKA